MTECLATHGSPIQGPETVLESGPEKKYKSQKWNEAEHLSEQDMTVTLWITTVTLWLSQQLA